MALSNAERQRRKRENAKLKVRTAPDLSPAASIIFEMFVRQANRAKEGLKATPSPLTGVHDLLAEASANFASIGFEIYLEQVFEEQVDPQWTPDWGLPDRGAIGRAERMVDVCIANAKALSEVINKFKMLGVETAQERLAKRDLSTSEAKRKAMAEAVRLDKIESRLRKEVRHSFHPIAVKGEV